MNSVQLLEMSKKQSKHRGKYELILHNDNTTSFDHVIQCLIEICGHNEYQADQCALLTHKRNKCSVFVDKYETCKSVWDNLVKAGLTVTVQKRKK
jgi:ATP-dependent Clp protease adaptor protein ClpS